ncbi:TIGR04211 family SH3 domain-containing protein [Alteromonas facilis]|uniref:TIGR04211 family SH3 domain-containing protein n=1 Tax=Alteromonas facilis TaxID=2048004 RepID=UPI0013D9CAEB|nr:TIGR04211 family SH3 domain-containing protein [Alteromonas facilis]
MRSLFFSVLMLTFTAFITTAQVAAQSSESNANVMDDLTVYLHTGPGRDYRITGQLVAGSSITILDREGDPAFVQVTDAQGRTGWIEARYVSTQGSIRQELPRLREALAEATDSLTSVQQQQQRLQRENSSLTQQNQRLAQQLEESLQQQANIQAQLDNADNSAMIEWFTRGGIIAAACIVLGILITYIPKKRRRNDQWM